MGDAPFLMPSDPAAPPPSLSRDRDRDRDRSTPDPPSSASSKRRWSPCTWRYAIEEVQPELASKPRGNYIIPPPSALPRDRDRAPEMPRKLPSPDKAGEAPLDGCDQIPAGQSPSGQSAERGGVYKRQGQKDGEEMEHGGLRKGGLVKRVAGQKEGDLLEERMRRKKKKEGSRRRVEREVYYEDASKRRKREMTPSELYFCEICAAKASNGSRSPEDESC